MIETIKKLVQQYFNLEGQFSPLPGYDDLNFKLDSIDGSTFITKLMHTGCDSDNIAFQCATLSHLEAHSSSLNFPKVLSSANGNNFEIVSVNGEQRILWILTWCEGHLLGNFKPQSNALMLSLGQAVAQMTNLLEGFSHPAMKNGHPWELTKTLERKELLQYIKGPVKEIAVSIFEQFENETLPQLSGLPQSVTHNDANDFNTLVETDESGNAAVTGIFDFGDLGYQPTICEAAIAMAYGILRIENPLRACFHFLKGYAAVRSISEVELEVLFHLIKTRLAFSVANSSYRDTIEDNPYIAISQKPAIEALIKLDQIPSELALIFFRIAMGYPATSHYTEIIEFIKQSEPLAHPVMQVDQFDHIMDLSVSSLMLGADPTSTRLEGLSKKVNEFMIENQSPFAFGRYLESRQLYGVANFGQAGHPVKESRNIHLGIDIFSEAGSPVFAPFDGCIAISTIIDLPLDYGGVIFLEHQTANGHLFYTLFGHLAHESLQHKVGQEVKAGEQIASLGEPHENGGWPPHLHFQIITDLAGLGQQFPGVAFQEEIEIWKALSPNPMLLFDVPDISIYNAIPDYNKLLTQRKKLLGFNLSLTYDQPLHIVSGFRQFLYDSHANRYLDFYNNVPHVGHQHPDVVKAIQKQVALLNTNTRYLHQNIVDYAQRLSAKLPDQLEVCYFVNSATEANELAIRLARNYTTKKDIMVVESAYHGHTNTLIDISPYKHDGPGGQGAPEWVHTIPIADDYRGKWKRSDPEAGHNYAAEALDIILQIKANGHDLAAFIAETYPSVGGQIIPPKGYLQQVCQYLKEHDILYIADEVQTGFGRLGQSFWAFETQDIIPDIVVLGKPIGNGFPLGAVITTKAIAESFDNGMEYFSTFGGNPVACAAGIAVLDVIEKEALQQNAEHLGTLIRKEFSRLKDQFPIIGDVRGEGLYLGMELVRDRDSLEPADREANYVINRLKDFRILAGTDGPHHNVLKFRPSMVSTEADVKYFIECLESILGETFLS